MKASITTTFYLLLLLLLLYTTTTVATPPPSAKQNATAESPSSPPTTYTLDPLQLRALQFLHIPTTQDPCTTTSTCDNATPFRHLLSLRLTDCPSDHHLSTTTLSTLSTLTSITFFNCHIPIIHFPSSLTTNLHSFTSINSLQHLTGVFLSHFHNITHLYISGDPIKASGIHIITSNMKSLKTITLYNTHLTGYLPKNWNPKLTHIDFSKNKLKGSIPTSLTQLKNLKVLNFSSNNLIGVLPNSLGALTSLKMLSLSSNSLSGPIPGSISSISGLVHLDLGSNQFNGLIPEFISEMKEVKYLNLENNKFHGVLPFNASFIKKLDVFKINGNFDLCYKHSTSLEELHLGIARCDKRGMPILPPPEAMNTPSSWVDVGGGGESGGDDDVVEKNDQVHVNRGPNKVVLGVAIALSAMVFIIIFLVLLFIC